VDLRDLYVSAFFNNDDDDEDDDDFFKGKFTKKG